jgi:hypothetical protein
MCRSRRNATPRIVAGRRIAAAPIERAAPI